MKTYHIIAVHRDRTGDIVSARFLEHGCRCLSRAELLHYVDSSSPVRIAFLKCGQWCDGGRVRCRHGVLCTKGESASGDGLAALPNY